SPPLTTNHPSDVPCPLPRWIERVRLSIASPLMQPSPSDRRVGIRIVTFEACSGFTRVTARRIARPPKAAFVTRLQPRHCTTELLVSYRTYPTIIRVEPSSTSDSRRQGALPEPDLQVVRPSVGRPPAQEGKRHIDEEDQNAHREDISADGRYQVPDIERPQIHSRQTYDLSHDVSRDEDGGTDKRQPEMNYPEKVGIATASDLGEEIVPDGENAEPRGPPERVVHVPVLVSHFDVGVLKRAVCADVGQRDNIQSADRGHDDEADCPKHRRAEGDHPVLLATAPKKL